jgi:hypothetical protein
MLSDRDCITAVIEDPHELSLRVEGEENEAGDAIRGEEEGGLLNVRAVGGEECPSQ